MPIFCRIVLLIRVANREVVIGTSFYYSGWIEFINHIDPEIASGVAVVAHISYIQDTVIKGYVFPIVMPGGLNFMPIPFVRIFRLNPRWNLYLSLDVDGKNASLIARIVVDPVDVVLLRCNDTTHLLKFGMRHAGDLFYGLAAMCQHSQSNR